MPRAFARGILIQILMDGRAGNRARANKARLFVRQLESF
jgi:hypothetical protein